MSASWSTAGRAGIITLGAVRVIHRESVGRIRMMTGRTWMSSPREAMILVFIPTRQGTGRVPWVASGREILDYLGCMCVILSGVATDSS